MKPEAGQSLLRSPAALVRDFLALVKIGIVGSNALTTMAGFALAAGRAARSGTVGLDALAGAGLWKTAAVVLCGSSTLVAGSCVLNNWIDRDIDALMPRTRGRPTAGGRIGGGAAVGMGLAFIALGISLLALRGPVPALLGVAGAFIYIVVYSLAAKRHTALSSFIGGIAGATPPLMGWSTIDPRLHPPAWVLFALLVIWQQAHVRALALYRAEEYGKAGLPMAGFRRPNSGGEAQASPEVWLVLWVSVLLLFSPLLLPLGKAVFAASLLLALGWLGICIGNLPRSGHFRSGRKTAMFVSSLVYLIALCAVLLVSPVLA